MSEDDKMIPSGPFKGKKIEFASTTGIDLFAVSRQRSAFSTYCIALSC